MTQSRREWLSAGVRLFNSTRYWDAHEAWEHAWMPDRHGPDGDFYKGLIQVAAGCLHYQRHNRKGARMKWASGADFLRGYEPIHQGLDVTSLVRWTDKAVERIDVEEWPELALPKLRIGATPM